MESVNLPLSLRLVFFQMGPVAVELSQLLGTRFVPGERTYNGPISEDLARIIVHLNQGELQLAQLEITRLALLARDLRVVADHDQALLERFRKKLTNPAVGNYYGNRCELFVARGLIKLGISFVYDVPRRPDFAIGAIGIECTSAYSQLASRTRINQKVSRAIVDKGKEVYCNQRTALIVDVTGIRFRSWAELGGPLGKDQVKDIVNRAMRRAPFGSVVVSTLAADEGAEVVERLYSRFDASGIAPELRSLLNRAYPLGDETRSGIRTPLRP
jgi:hypothetical protein